MSNLNIQELDKLNQLALSYIDKYMHLQICGKDVHAPYYINRIQHFYTAILKSVGISQELIKKVNDEYKNRKIPFGWYRGKGTPEQLSESAIKVAEGNELNISSLSSKSIEDFMKLYGIGIDCSGFVYNTLVFAFDGIGKSDVFNNSIVWASKEGVGLNYANCNIFAKSSTLVDETRIEPLDLILIKNRLIEDYPHIGLVLKDKVNLVFAESTISMYPSGVHIGNFELRNGKMFIEGEHKFSDYIVEVRRLNCI